uniref:hypothetical protein n=1 Tax=Prevotella sp. TaxID=59823 RepID=UPI00402696C3
MMKKNVYIQPGIKIRAIDSDTDLLSDSKTIPVATPKSSEEEGQYTPTAKGLADGGNWNVWEDDDE